MFHIIKLSEVELHIDEHDHESCSHHEDVGEDGLTRNVAETPGDVSKNPEVIIIIRGIQKNFDDFILELQSFLVDLFSNEKP